MNRLIRHVATGVILLGIAGLAACSTANTKPAGPAATPTPSPTPEFSNETYAKALRTASVKLQGTLPAYADVQSVLAGGQPAYETILDRMLDPATNPALGPQIRLFYNSMFLMGQTVTVQVGATNVTYNDDETPNLATYVMLQDKPVTELLTADYCISNAFAPYTAGTVVDGSPADATGCPSDSTPATERAGILSQKTYLAKFGTANTVNMRRASVTHQLFDCNIYPDSQDVPIARTNDTTPNNTTTGSNASCAVTGCPDNSSGVSGTTPGGCTGSLNYPCNNNDTPADYTDDFADPALGLVANDPDSPRRLSKKYQSKLKGAAGRECHDCHGSLNARRPIFTPYDENGIYDMNRTTQDVEPPTVNGGNDYCGMAQLPAANDPTDDIDPSAFDCLQGAKPQAVYFGTNLNSLKDFGAGIMAQPRFFDCMTIRHYDFVLGKSQGELGLQAAGGSPPVAVDPAVLAKYRVLYEASGWNTKELIRAVFKGNEFIASQK